MATETEFDIPAIEISTFELTLVGDSPLIVHAWYHLLVVFLKPIDDFIITDRSF